MSDMVDFYQQHIPFSKTPWLHALQKNAHADFMHLGFPTRRHEEWKYTQLDAFLKESFVPATANTSPTPVSDVPLGDKIYILNGEVMMDKTLAANWPKGVIVTSLLDAATHHAEKLEAYLGQILPHDHAFQALNTAMLQTGVFIYVPENVKIPNPIVLVHRQDHAHQAVHSRIVVAAQSNSELCLIEDYQGSDVVYFTNTMTEIYAAAKAQVTHLKIQRESNKAYHVGHFAAQQETESSVSTHAFSLGGKLVRSDVSIRLSEPFATSLLNGVYIPLKGQHIDHHTVVHHDVPDCSSQQDYKGIIANHARAVFNGKVIVPKGAQHTLAKQQNKNLLLGEQAEIDTKPQLEIYADDVVCTHGATVGQLDEEALFYFATRGIKEEQARQFLIQAFMAENLRFISNNVLSEWIDQLITNVTEQLGQDYE